MTKVIIVAALWLVISTTTGTATTTDIEGRTLYTMCAPMMFVVEELPLEDIQKTGLTHKAITNAVESRLRGSRLFAPFEKLELERQQYLYINVHIMSPAFSIRVVLNRYIEDLGYGLPGVATVWDAGSIGTHGGDGQYIIGAIYRHLDEFIASYLRVNEAHCSR